jgi:hypothetical protein
MKLWSTIFAGALAVGASMLGCSEDDPAATGGTSGTGAGATGGGGSSGRGGSGGSAGSAGSGGSAGSAGSAGSGMDARVDSAIQCNSAAGVQECKRIGNEEGVCSGLVDCSCDRCTCLLADCEARPACLALRRCALRTGCCSPTLSGCAPQGCCTGVDCTTACLNEITAANMETWDGGNSFQLALNLDICVFTSPDGGAACTPCPIPDAGDAAGGG